MKRKRIIRLIHIPIAIAPVSTSGFNTGYLIGAIIAVMILVYLIYSIARPEKF